MSVHIALYVCCTVHDVCLCRVVCLCLGVAQHMYVTGTTEKIFESKSHLYDVYVDNQNIRCSQDVFRDVLKPSAADKSRLVQLTNQW